MTNSPPSAKQDFIQDEAREGQRVAADRRRFKERDRAELLSPPDLTAGELSNPFPAASCFEEESGLFTQGHFNSVLERELARLDRGGKALSLLVLQPPPMNAENWASFGRLLLASLRRIDLAARLGDGRVAVLLPECDLLRARRWINQLLDAINQENHFAGSGLAVGRALALPWEGRRADELMKLAEDDLRDPGREEPAEDDDDDSTAIAPDERSLLFDGFKALGGVN